MCLFVCFIYCFCCVFVFRVVVCALVGPAGLADKCFIIVCVLYVVFVFHVVVVGSAGLVDVSAGLVEKRSMCFNCGFWCVCFVWWWLGRLGWWTSVCFCVSYVVFRVVVCVGWVVWDGGQVLIIVCLRVSYALFIAVLFC